MCPWLLSMMNQGCVCRRVEATEENVSNGTYVVQRPFVQIYTKGTDSELVKAWFDFLKSDEGQQIIADQKLVTVDIDENTENQ